MSGNKKGSGGNSGSSNTPSPSQKSHGSQMPAREIRNNGDSKIPKSDRPTNSGGPREKG